LSVESLEARAMLSTTAMVSSVAPRAAIVPHQLVQPPVANIGILLLDHTGNGALTRTGNGGIFVTNGDIVIDSSNKQAGLITGKGNVVANDIFVTGGLKHTGKGTFKGNIVTGVPPTADPLAGLPEPVPTGPFFGAVNVGNHTSLTLSPGTYTGGIHISGRASVTLLPGLYYLKGGGLSVSGNATLTGNGVTIFNGPKNTHDSIVFSGQAHVTLAAPVAGTYQGIVLFQSRTSTAPITISASGANLTGEVYGAKALLNISGNGNVFINGLENESILAGVIVKDLLDSGNTNLFVNAIASGVEGDLSITKEDDVGGSSITGSTGVLTPGGTITYTITVTNNGPSNVVGASVTDVFPADITSDTFTAAETGGATGFTASGSGNIRDAVNLPSGATITYTVVANVSASASDSLSNTATVTPPFGVTDVDLTNNTATDVDTQQVDLVITKIDNVGGSSITPATGSAVAGGTVTYTIVVTNAGPGPATGASVTDSFPAAIASDTFTAVGDGGATGFSTSGSGDINDTVDLPVGASITYTVTAQVASSATGSLSNTAAVEPGGSQVDVDLTNNTATDEDTLTQSVDLAITKTDNMATAAPGGSTTYTIVVSNSGPSDAVGASVNDTFSASITSDSFTAVGTTGTSGFSATGTGAIHNTVTIPAGGNITYTVTANIGATATGSLSNTATVTKPAGATEANLANNSATDTDTLTPTADLTVTKVDNVGGSSITGTTGSVAAGGTLTFTIVLRNSGPSTAAGVNISDVFPAAIASDTFTAVGTTGTSGFSASGTGAINNTVTVPSGGSITYTVVANVSAAATVGATMGNSAIITTPLGLIDTNPVKVATDLDLVTAGIGIG
jgi:uncharacterized repeat protein (TIGR01451 family)